MEVPAKALLASYWNGHNQEDECPFTFNKGLSQDEQALRKAQQQDRKERESLARTKLRIAANQNLVVVETFSTESEHDTFNGFNYPEGTILRIQSELLSRDTLPRIEPIFRLLALALQGDKTAFSEFDFTSLSRWRKPEYYSRQDLGILIASSAYPELHRMRVMKGNEETFKNSFSHRNDRYPYIFDQRAFIQTGVVKHARYAYPSYYPFIVPDSESLSRVNKIEILGAY